jgi:hypothetical protein
MMVQTYASPPAFKQALEQRLKSSSSGGVDFARRRQLLVFDRFLARIVAIFGTAALLKAHKRQLTTLMHGPLGRLRLPLSNAATRS